MNEDQSQNPGTAVWDAAIKAAMSADQDYTFVRFDALVPGDRFITANRTLWTKLDSETARKHSEGSRDLAHRGYGYHGDTVCSFEGGDAVAFVPPSV